MKWSTVQIFVDQQTGEVLTKQEAKLNYFTVKKIKNVKIVKEIIWREIEHKRVGETTKRGIVEWTVECRRHGQQRLFEAG
ncbi:MAG: hypothetical protein [Malazfec virus 2]